MEEITFRSWWKIMLTGLIIFSATWAIGYFGGEEV